MTKLKPKSTLNNKKIHKCLFQEDEYGVLKCKCGRTYTNPIEINIKKKATFLIDVKSTEIEQVNLFRDVIIDRIVACFDNRQSILGHEIVNVETFGINERTVKIELRG